MEMKTFRPWMLKGGKWRIGLVGFIWLSLQRCLEWCT
jgi:hypothetical protein